MLINGVVAALASTLLSAAILGIFYFVFLARNNKGIGKRNITWLTIIGAIILVISCVIGGLYVTMGIQGILNSVVNTATILSTISNLLSGVEVIMMGCLYFAFPLYLKRR